MSTPVTATRAALLRLLADGALHSGAALAARLGLSRSAIAKHLRQLERERALPIQRIKGHGYRLLAPLTLLDAERIRAALPATARAWIGNLIIAEQTDSTNSDALRAAAKGVASGTCFLAERQTAGRGRGGRPWVSPFAANLYGSLLWRDPDGPARLGGLSLAAGVAVARALETAGARRLALKWPNDIHWQGRKLAGLLIEVSGETQGPSQIVVGVGVNLRMPVGVGAEIDQPWVDLAEAMGGTPPDRNRLAGLLLGELALTLAAWPHAGLAAALEPWRARDGYCGQPATVLLGTRRIAGTYLGIDDQGAALLSHNGQVLAFQSGEIRLRLTTASSFAS